MVCSNNASICLFSTVLRFIQILDLKTITILHDGSIYINSE